MFIKQYDNLLWIKKEAKKIWSSKVEAKKEIQILEMDELYTYIKKIK